MGDTATYSSVRPRTVGGMHDDAGATATLSARATSILQSAEFQRSEENAAKRAARLVAAPLPEVHFVGELCGATGFGAAPICCRWTVEHGDQWEWLEGMRSGHTQTADPDSSAQRLAVWAHPLDLHFAAGAAAGWPRIVVQVFALDSVGRLEIAGYGSAALPTSPGPHELRLPTWRPEGTVGQEYAAFFIGGAPALRLPSSETIGDVTPSRVGMTTVSGGDVHVRLQVIFRHGVSAGLDAAIAHST